MVPVEAAYQVWRVAKVLSMGIVCTHVQGVPENSCQIKPWNFLRKCNFNIFNVKIGLFLLILNLTFPLIQFYWFWDWSSIQNNPGLWESPSQPSLVNKARESAAGDGAMACPAPPKAGHPQESLWLNTQALMALFDDSQGGPTKYWEVNLWYVRASDWFCV